MSKDNKIQHTKKALLEALKSSRGIVSAACEVVGVDRSTYYRYYNDDEVFRNECNDIENLVIDFAESKLYEQIKGNNITAIIFYLKTKGKRRGYYEKSISLNVNENNDKPEIDYSQLSESTLRDIIKNVKPKTTGNNRDNLLTEPIKIIYNVPNK